MKVVVRKILSGFFFFLATWLQAQENLQTVGTLPNVVSETSGLLYFNESLITHNDSGNDPVLYELDTLLLTIKRTVTIANVDNTDWEAITQDENYIYIGDFGNNLGLRTNLAIHRITKSDYLNSDTVTATTINFSYEDQTDFSNNGNSDWDAEAFFVLGDQLIILTKQWQSQGSTAYAVPKTPGNFVATRVSTLSNSGFITDATYNPSNNRLVVLGYSNVLIPFVGIVEDLDPTAIFEGFTQTFLDLNFVQAEGITYTSENNYFFSSEYFSRQTPSIESDSRLFSFQLRNNTTEIPEEPSPQEPYNPENPKEPEDKEDKNELRIFRDNTTNQYHYTLLTTKTVYGQIIFDVLGRPVWQNSGEIAKEGTIAPHLETSIYYLTLYLEDTVIATPFVVY